MKHLLLVYGLLTIPIALAGQPVQNIISGLSLEIGGGYNQLFWTYEDLQSSNEANRTQFNVRPAFKAGYQFSFARSFGVYTFVGYNQIGGKSEVQNIFPVWELSTYEDEYRIETIEFGLMPSFSRNKLRISAGGKYNRHINYTHIFNHQNRPDGFNGENRNTDVDFFFADQSVDLGIRLEYAIYNTWMIASEAWFGITELSDPDLEDNPQILLQGGSYRIRQNHVRIYLGYRF
ncbi:MAG: hypothetical protein AAFW89_00770 [Bacteroidota bacterium]